MRRSNADSMRAGADLIIHSLGSKGALQQQAARPEPLRRVVQLAPPDVPVYVGRHRHAPVPQYPGHHFEVIGESPIPGEFRRWILVSANA